MKRFYDYLVGEYGQNNAFSYCLHMNEKAPLALRVNPLKISREELIERW